MCNYWIQLCERCFTPRRGGYRSADRNLGDGTCDQKVFREHYGLYPTLYWHERGRSRRFDGALLNDEVDEDLSLKIRIWLTPGCRHCLGKKAVYTKEGKTETLLTAAEVDAGTPEEEAELEDVDFEYLQAKRLMCIVLAEYPSFQEILPDEFLEWKTWKKENPDPDMEMFNKWILKEGEESKPAAKIPSLAFPSMEEFSRDLENTKIKLKLKASALAGSNVPSIEPPGGTLDFSSDVTNKYGFNDSFIALLGGWDDYALPEDARSLSIEYDSDSSVPSEVIYCDFDALKERKEQAGQS